MLPRLVGEKIAKEMMFTGKFISVKEAYRLGMINRVVPKEKLMDGVNNLVYELLKQSPHNTGLRQNGREQGLGDDAELGMRVEADLFRLCFSTEDQKELSKAFLEKRPPVIEGR